MKEKYIIVNPLREAAKQAMKDLKLLLDAAKKK
jgi:hypothetical protein